MTDQQRYLQLFRQMYELCRQNGWGDPFSYARSREIAMAVTLGHTIAPTYAGADAIDQQGDPVEYKSTIQDKLQGTYNGISVLDTWPEQADYLWYDKIGHYHDHFFARFDEGEIVQLYQMPGTLVWSSLIHKLKRAYHRDRGRDPRLSATLTHTEILNNGTRII